MLKVVGSSLLKRSVNTKLTRKFTTDKIIFSSLEENKEIVEFRDIFVVGGGVAGLTLVNLLGSKLSQVSSVAYQPKISLVDRNPLDSSYNPGPEYSNRVVSLTPQSLDILNQSKVYEHLDQSRICPYRNILVEDSLGGGKLKFEVEGGSEGDSMAYSVEINNLSQALLKGIEKSNQNSTDKVEVLGSSEVLNISEGTDGFVDVQVKSNETGQTTVYKCRLVVGADGIGSKVRLFKNIQVQGWSYDQLGLVATLKTETDFSPLSLAYQRFLPTGTIAFLPLNDNRLSLVWSLPKLLAQKVQKLDGTLLTGLLNTTLHYPQVDISYLLDRVAKDQLDSEDLDLSFRANAKQDRGYTISGIVDNSVATFPLQLRHVSSYVEERVALIGDAAHVIHPLAGQGMNLGIYDAQSLADNLTTSLTNGYDLGDKLVLQDYARQRYFKNLVMLGAVDKLQRIFSTESQLVAKVRSLGMNFLNSDLIGSLKQQVVNMVRRG